MNSPLIVQIIKAAIEEWDLRQRRRFVRVAGLEPGSGVTVYAPWTGVALDSGIESNGLFISKVLFRKGRNYQIVIRNTGYQTLSIPTCVADITVQMTKDLTV